MFQRGGFLTVFLITRFRHWNSRISTSRNIAKMFTLGVILPWHNNCCRKFPWRYQKPSSGLVVGFGVIRQAGSMKCVQKLFLAVCHYDGPWYHAILGPIKTTLLICSTPIFNINRATTSHHDIVPSVNAPLCSRKHQTWGYISIHDGAVDVRLRDLGVVILRVGPSLGRLRAFFVDSSDCQFPLSSLVI